MPRKKPVEAKKPPQHVLIDRRNPLNALPAEEREAARQFAKPSGRRKALPGNWRQIVVAVCSRSWAQPLLARALGGSVDWLQARLKDTPELGDLIAQCDANYVQRLVRVIEERALAGDSNCAMWVASRLDPTRFGDKPQQPATLNVVLPMAPLDTEGYARLIAKVNADPARPALPAPIEAKP